MFVGTASGAASRGGGPELRSAARRSRAVGTERPQVEAAVNPPRARSPIWRVRSFPSATIPSAA